ncbi:hypothetical protein BS78_K222900 [Paspalum vaginatum]|uniref:Protein kinase domain-containing protein n=1 Tax=Paspalum vaginatum TaxID=158149 RepID=A0A9W7XDS0_9POAL|nr:hypothetical protein BS78_K222900 [Paspalum vaginatum]
MSKRQMAATMPAAPLSFTSLILSGIVVAAIALASCNGLPRNWRDVISFTFPSVDGPPYGYGRRELEYSWDAGALGGALHLTTDDMYQPPVRYAPDAQRSAGHVILKLGPAVPLALGRYGSSGRLSPVVLQEASFNTTFTMSVSRPLDGGLLFEVLPVHHRNGLDRAIYHSLCSSSSTTSSDSGSVSVEIGKLEYYYDQGQFAVYVSMVPRPTAAVTTTPAKNTVWIDYDAKGHNLSVYVAGEGRAKPGQATLHAPLNISAVVGAMVDENFYYDSRESLSYFGLFASKNRSLPSCQPVVYGWNLTMDWLSLPSTDTSSWSAADGGRRRRLRGRLVARVLSYLALAAAAAALLCAAACCVVSRYRALMMNQKLSKAMRRLPGVPREFRYADVKKATRNFDDSMRLGSGGFGAVYKGAMIATCDGDDGRQRLQYVEVAVKKFTRKETRSYDDFLAEVAVINRLRHRNIVPLIGWCYENAELLLIYQYMPIGSLDQHLFRQNRHQHLPVLRWETRYNIIKDVAAGLHYVHHEYERVVLHRDIKASNIMLDAAFHGRLGDFGLARVVAFDKTSFTDLGVAGTWGFIAPEYAVSHRATRQTDVYAFGVLVLEVVTGKRSLGAADDAFPLLTDRVWWLHGEGRLLEAMDDELTTTSVGVGEFDADDVARLLLLGLACTNPNASDRPTMAEVVQVVAKSTPPPDVPPAKPPFVWPPAEGNELSLSAASDDADDDDDDDDFVESNHRDSDIKHGEEEPDDAGAGLATSMRSSDVTKRKPRNTTTANVVAGDIENCV